MQVLSILHNSSLSSYSPPLANSVYYFNFYDVIRVSVSENNKIIKKRLQLEMKIDVCRMGIIIADLMSAATSADTDIL